MTKTRLKKQVAGASKAIIGALAVPAQALGLDLDGVIDENVHFFSTLSNVWPGEVYVVTYRESLIEAIADLRRFSIKYTDVILVNSFAEKADVIARLNIGVYVDDQDEVLMHVPGNVTVLKMRNGGNWDAHSRKWLYSGTTGRSI